MRDIYLPAPLEKTRDDKERETNAVFARGVQGTDRVAKEWPIRQIWSIPQKRVRPINLERRARFQRFEI